MIIYWPLASLSSSEGNTVILLLDPRDFVFGSTPRDIIQQNQDKRKSAAKEPMLKG